MGAFFQTGPVITTKEIPEFKDGKDAIVRVDDESIMPKATGDIELPISNLADWMWLQPHLAKDPQDIAVNPATAEDKTLYNVLNVTDVKQKPSWSGAPYTVTHGFLQAKVRKPAA